MFWFIEVLKRAFDFSGRSRRKEYWMYMLFYFIIVVILSIFENIFGLVLNDEIGVLTGLLGLILIIPSLSVLFRRLHDTGRSAWWILIGLIPLIGAIVLFIFTVLDSEPGLNKFGPNPKNI